MQVIRKLASGALLGGLSLLLSNPFDLAYIRLCSDVGEGEFKGLCDCLATIAARGGVFALYAGLWTSLAGIMIYRVAYFSFSSLSGLPHILRMEPGASLLARFAIAQAATVAATLASYPCTTVRHRLILQAGRAAPRYRGAFHCLAAVAREEGPAALFAGAGVAVGMSVASALLLVAYDLVTSVFLSKTDPLPDR